MLGFFMGDDIAVVNRGNVVCNEQRPGIWLLLEVWVIVRFEPIFNKFPELWDELRLPVSCDFIGHMPMGVVWCHHGSVVTSTATFIVRDRLILGP